MKKTNKIKNNNGSERKKKNEQYNVKRNKMEK